MYQCDAYDRALVIERLIQTFVRYRESEERFVDTVQRIGLELFKERVYAAQPA